jgi:hypothetical protein
MLGYTDWSGYVPDDAQVIAIPESRKERRRHVTPVYDALCHALEYEDGNGMWFKVDPNR